MKEREINELKVKSSNPLHMTPNSMIHVNTVRGSELREIEVKFWTPNYLGFGATVLHYTHRERNPQKKKSKKSYRDKCKLI